MTNCENFIKFTEKHCLDERTKIQLERLNARVFTQMNKNRAQTLLSLISLII